MSDGWKQGLERCGIPPYMHEGIENWIEHGLPPGSFLRAVFSNDLVGAYITADMVNTHCMREYAHFLYGYAPAGCHGSAEVLRTWKGLQHTGVTHD